MTTTTERRPRAKRSTKIIWSATCLWAAVLLGALGHFSTADDPACDSSRESCTCVSDCQSTRDRCIDDVNKSLVDCSAAVQDVASNNCSDKSHDQRKLCGIFVYSGAEAESHTDGCVDMKSEFDQCVDDEVNGGQIEYTGFSLSPLTLGFKVTKGTSSNCTAKDNSAETQCYQNFYGCRRGCADSSKDTESGSGSGSNDYSGSGGYTSPSDSSSNWY